MSFIFTVFKSYFIFEKTRKTNTLYSPFLIQKNTEKDNIFLVFSKIVKNRNWTYSTFKCLFPQKTWCVAKPSSSDEELRENRNFACSEVRCDEISGKGKPCSIPATLINQASVAMNLYYQEKGRNSWNCNFRNSALITMTDPSKLALLIML